MLKTLPHNTDTRSEMTDEKEIFYRHIQRAGLKRTAQRDLIVDVFLRTEDHLSSEDLYRLVKEQDQTIGQTTVYRTLKLLTEAGLASEVRFGDGRTRYEPVGKFPHHDHMICTSCNRTIEFYSAEIKALQERVAVEHGFATTQHSLRIFGTCQECQKLATTKVKQGATVEQHLDFARTGK